MRRFALALLAALAAAPAAAAERAPAALGPEDRATVARVERALNGVRTLKSRFLQVTSNGGTAEGELWLARPGHMLIDYAPPTPLKLVVNETWVIQVDTKLGALTYIPIGRTPAGLLIRDRVTLDGEVSVTAIQRASGVVRVTMVRKGAEDEGTLTMVFAEEGMALRQWSVLDAQGVETRITLLDPQVNVALDPKLFDFDASKYDPTRLD
jgi:outer membrane lipoprotein-sorting protein